MVAATDYVGLGTPGTHPYMIGVSEGRAVLDMVRAAMAMPEPGASERFVVWGHSQGGHAALFTGELAAQYAPELKLLGVAAAAPATYLGELFAADIDGAGGRALASYTIWSWSRIYHVPVDTVLFPQAMPAFERVAAGCIEALNQALGVAIAERPLQRVFLKVNIIRTEPWKTFIARNTPGHAPAGMAYFIAQGTADTTVRPRITAQFMRALCQQNVPVASSACPAWIIPRSRGAQPAQPSHGWPTASPEHRRRMIASGEARKKIKAGPQGPGLHERHVTRRYCCSLSHCSRTIDLAMRALALTTSQFTTWRCDVCVGAGDACDGANIASWT